MFDKPYSELTPKEKIEREIFLLECKDNWNPADFARAYELYDSLAKMR